MEQVCENILAGVQMFMLFMNSDDICLQPKAEYLECITVNALKDAGYSVAEWCPSGQGSHRSGYDFICGNGNGNGNLEYGGRIQQKTGKWGKKGLTITSSRTTKHRTLEDKKNFMKEDHQDNLWSVSIKDDKLIIAIINGQNLLCDKCNIDEITWEETTSNWVGSDLTGKVLNIKIVKQASDQLIYTLTKDCIDFYKEMNLN